jgi:hypothetical protein
MKRVLMVLGLLLTLLLEGTAFSAQSVLTDIWKDKEYRGTVNKIAVFWSARVARNRIFAENEFVRQLRAREITAMPVYVVIPPDKFIDRDAALAKIRTLGVDAILMLRLIDKQTAESTISQPGPAGTSRLSEYYRNLYDAPVRDESELVFLETSLFDVKSERRIWTARSVTKVDTVDQKALAGFIGIMIDQLALDKMIP